MEVVDETEFGTYRILQVSFARTPLPNNRVRESGGFYAARDGGNKGGKSGKEDARKEWGTWKIGGRRKWIGRKRPPKSVAEFVAHGLTER